MTLINRLPPVGHLTLVVFLVVISGPLVPWVLLATSGLVLETLISDINLAVLLTMIFVFLFTAAAAFLLRFPFSILATLSHSLFNLMVFGIPIDSLFVHPWFAPALYGYVVGGLFSLLRGRSDQ